MKDTVKQYLHKWERTAKKRKLTLAVIISLSLVVAISVTWMLHQSAVAKTNSIHCGLKEHKHTEACVERTLACSLSESDGHRHSDDCYDIKYICKYNYEHEHSLACYSDAAADTENKDDWENSFKGIDFVGANAIDLLTVAKTQLGYAESTKNYQVIIDSDGNEIIKGYTRYGQWYGDKYGDWNATFVAFCLKYANVPGVEVPEYKNSCAEWLDILSSKKYDLFRNASGYKPLPGDLAFFDIDSDGIADRIGIVSETNSSNFKTIEGQVDGKVKKAKHNYSSKNIVGYVAIPGHDFVDPSTLSKKELAERLISLIDELPLVSEVKNTLDGYMASGDRESYTTYYNGLSKRINNYRALCEYLGKDVDSLVKNIDKLRAFDDIITSNAKNYGTITVYALNNYIYRWNCVTFYNTKGKTLGEMADYSGNIRNLDIVLVKKQGNNYVVAEMYERFTLTDEEAWSIVLPKDGFIMLFSRNYEAGNSTLNARVGDIVTFSKIKNKPFWMTTDEKSTSANGYGTITFETSSMALEPAVKPVKDNTGALQTINGADTSGFVNIGLYNYNEKINSLYNSNNSLPGFQQDYGTYDLSELNSGSYNFGNNITADLGAGHSGVIRPAGGSSVININMLEAGGSYPISHAGNIMAPVLQDGYPAISNGNGSVSLEALFSNSEYAEKVNSKGINGLFQYNEETGVYEYDSRKNHAQYNYENGTFTLYKQALTSNGMMYPFGSFLPFNDIVAGKQSSQINAAYLMQIAASALQKANDGFDDEFTDNPNMPIDNPYAELAASLYNFIELMNDKHSEGWTAVDALNDYFEFAGIRDSNGNIVQFTSADLDNIYTIDYDEPTDFYFGMDLEMNFTQANGGVTSKNKPMVFHFEGNDDAWFYVDGVLFLDLSGVHQSVGGEIDFQKGEVRYYAFDSTTGRASKNAYLTKTFREIFRSAGKSTEEINEILKINSYGYETFRDYSPHNLHFYYMNRNSGASVVNFGFNMQGIVPTSIMSVDQYGNAIAGATFATYKANDTYQYLTDNGNYVNLTNNAEVDEQTGVITDGANRITPAYVGTTDDNGIMTFKRDDGTAYTIDELIRLTCGNFSNSAKPKKPFILREIKTPDGYRTVTNATKMYIMGDQLISDAPYESGVWASPNALIQATNLLSNAATPEVNDITYVDEDGIVHGTLFAVILKRNDAPVPEVGDIGYDYVNQWYALYGNSTDGYQVMQESNMQSIIDAARIGQSYGNMVFQLSTNGMPSLYIEDLPGKITSYYTYMVDNGLFGRPNTTGEDLQYAVAYFYTTADSLEGATTENTVRVNSHCDEVLGNPDVAGFTVDWSSTIKVPNFENRLFINKRDEEGELVNNAVFGLYNVGEEDDEMYYIADDGTHVYLKLDNGEDGDSVAGDNQGIAIVNGVTGTYSVNTSIDSSAFVNGYIVAENAGYITVDVGGNTYTVKPATKADDNETRLVSYTHDSCESVAEDGTAHFGLLRKGWYVLREIIPPYGYTINPNQVKVVVDDSGVYANAGVAGDSILVGNGPGYLSKTLNEFASMNVVDETLTWVYSQLAVRQASTFAAFADIRHNNNYRYAKQLSGDYAGYASGITVGNSSTDRESAMVSYIVFDPTRATALFDYAPNADQSERHRGSPQIGANSINTLSGQGTLRLYTDIGWSSLQIYQDYVYGYRQNSTNVMTNYDDITGRNLANLFSQSTFVQYVDPIDVDINISKVGDDHTEENPKYLDGTEFVLKNSDGQYYQYDPISDMIVWVYAADDASAPKLVTATDGDRKAYFTIFGLSDGEYTLIETKTMLGYEPVDPITIKIGTQYIDVQELDADGLPMSNDDGTPLMRQVRTYCTLDGRPIDRVDTNPDSPYCMENETSYQYMYELRDPTGIASVEIKNLEVNTNPTVPLEGAEFVLYRTAETRLEIKSGDVMLMSTIEYYSAAGDSSEMAGWVNDIAQATRFTCNENGVALDENGNGVQGLISGDYYLKELKAPNGYPLINTPIKFNISFKAVAGSSKKAVITIEPTIDPKPVSSVLNTNDGCTLIVNNYKSAMLPNTGGIGTNWYTFGGLLLTASLVYSYNVSLRRKRKLFNK